MAEEVKELSRRRLGAGAFLRQDIPPPSAYYVREDESLIVDASGWIDNLTLTLRARVLGVDGKVRIYSRDFVVDAGLEYDRRLVQLGEGWLLGMALEVTAGAIFWGVLYARVGIGVGGAASAVPTAWLIGGYLTELSGLGWPGSPLLPSQSGQGRISTFSVATPAAGVEFSQAVSSLQRWRVMSVAARFTASATVATRYCRLALLAGGVAHFQTQERVGMPASTVWDFTWAAGAADFAWAGATNVAFVPIPPLFVNSLFTFQSVTSNFQVGDTWTNIRLLVERWTDL